ncbi:unnamed protein product [Leptidea sinapis]|uniref:Uncharacterized protein n=1 Tax=Leptidea sinapis TaxID=189913 RepID=A0A5E4QTH3_9NEOP|nr:unnamed protein product [Leptidea sinapis]
MKVLNNSSSEEDEEMSIYSEEEPVIEEEAEFQVINPDKLPKEGDFVLVLFKVKSKNIYYIAKVIGEKGGQTEISFLRNQSKTQTNFTCLLFQILPRSHCSILN